MLYFYIFLCIFLSVFPSIKVTLRHLIPIPKKRTRKAQMLWKKLRKICLNLRLWNLLKSHCGLFFWWMEWFWYFLDICCIWIMWESLFYDSVFHLSSDRSILINMCAPILTKIVSPLSKKNLSHISSKRTSDDPNWRSLYLCSLYVWWDS